MGVRARCWAEGKKKDRKRVRGKLRFNIPTLASHRPRSVTSSASSTMSVRVFPPSDEKHDDFEFHLDRFMGKWSVVSSRHFEDFS